MKRDYALSPAGLDAHVFETKWKSSRASGDLLQGINNNTGEMILFQKG